MPLELEEFDRGAAPAAPAAAPEPEPRGMDPDAVEAEKLAAYEQGYKAGWDDAARAEAEDQSRIGADFARSLQEIAFTFHEARAHVLHSMEPLLDGIVETFVPGLIAETMGARILEELRPLAEDAADAPVELVVAPESRPALERQIEEAGIAAVRLAEEPSLAPGQVYLRVGQAERDIDLAGALDRVNEAIRALYQMNERTLKHG